MRFHDSGMGFWSRCSCDANSLWIENNSTGEELSVGGGGSVSLLKTKDVLLTLTARHLFCKPGKAQPARRLTVMGYCYCLAYSLNLSRFHTSYPFSNTMGSVELKHTVFYCRSYLERHINPTYSRTGSKICSLFGVVKIQGWTSTDVGCCSWVEALCSCDSISDLRTSTKLGTSEGFHHLREVCQTPSFRFSLRDTGWVLILLPYGLDLIFLY